MGLSLRVSHLQWAFDTRSEPFLVLDELSVAPGSSLAISGPSGSGKSSLVFVLSGMERPRSGTVAWGGQDVTTLGEAARDAWRRHHAGLLFQDFHLVPPLSALENVLLPTTFDRWRPRSEDVSRAYELLDRVGIRKPHQRAGTLSRGEMQRTALARALLFRPQVLFADEPTASLDEASESAVADLVFEAVEHESITLIMTTHQARLRDRADAQLELSHGRVVSGGLR